MLSMGTPINMSDTPPEVKVKSARKLFLSGASIVWIIPILALVAALGVAFSSYNSRGPVIFVEFDKGAGIKAGEGRLAQCIRDKREAVSPACAKTVDELLPQAKG